MLEELLTKNEGKTLEFKENTQSLQKIIQTVVAFANTAGGTIVIGVKDKTKEVIGLKDLLLEEEKIANSISASISPLIIPTIQFYTWRNRDILIIIVPHNFAPYYLKSKGIEQGTFVRIGSTNRIADSQKISEIQQLKNNKHFDELPNIKASNKNIDYNLVSKLFAKVEKKFTEQNAKSLGLLVPYDSKFFPSNGSLILFSDQITTFFPDAIIRLGRFSGFDKSNIIDSKILEMPISIVLDPIIDFIKRHTSEAFEIKGIKRKNIPQYPEEVLKEAITNALLHADYSITGAHIQVAIFNDRIEITNPGGLPLGLSMEVALSGISQLRNRVIGRVFRELDIIEQWGSGLARMIRICSEQNIDLPKFEELGNFFRVTLYWKKSIVNIKDWQIVIINYLKINSAISVKEAAELWKVSHRSAGGRLKKMFLKGTIVEISTGPFDPQKKYKLSE